MTTSIGRDRRVPTQNHQACSRDVRLDRLTARQLIAFYGGLQEKGLSGSSIQRHHSVLHASLGRTVKWGLIAASPADRATASRPSRSTATAPAVAEVQKLIAEAEADGDHVLATAIALGAVTGRAVRTPVERRGLAPGRAHVVPFLERSRSQGNRATNEDPSAP
jgi:site-specific recombinase XerD